MQKSLLIEPGSHATDLIIDSNKKIDFQEYVYELCSTFSEINLYEVDEEVYYEQNDCKKELILSIYGRYFDIDYALNNGINLAKVFDLYDADTASLIPFLLDEDGRIKDEYRTNYSNIYYLDRIKTEDKYKGKGYATFILKNLPEILMYMSKLSVGIIIVQAQPFDGIDGKTIMDYNDKKRTERLIKLYEKAGFKRIDNSNYLILINE